MSEPTPSVEPTPLRLTAAAAAARLADTKQPPPNEEVELRGLRVTHRQRFGKALQFVGMRAVDGTKVEMILKREYFEPAPGVELTGCCRLGDVVSVLGRLEMHEGRLSIMARVVRVQEPWADVFGQAMFHDYWAAAPGAGNVLVQCCASHATRLSEYLHALLGLETLAMVVPVTGRGGRDERGLLLQADEPAAVFAALRSDPNVARVVRRWYLLGDRHATIDDVASSLNAQIAELQQQQKPPPPPQPGATPPASEEALSSDDAAVAAAAAAVARAAVGSAIAAADGATDTTASATATSAAAPVPVRLHTFPRSLEGLLAPRIVAGGAAQLRPQSDSAVLCVVFLHGSYAAAIASAATLAGDLALSARPAGGEAVSRAYYKLHEVAARCDLKLSAESTAIDVGASPGGWSAFLAARCAGVVAVDPGALRTQGTPCADRIEHLPMLLEAALPQLRSRGAAFDAYCCDMNAPPSVAVGLLLDTLHAGLLRPGARIVLTFKSGAERKHEWQTVVDTEMERLRAVADDVRVIHLFANTSKECTVVCTLAAAAAPAPAAPPPAAPVAAPRLQCCSSRRPPPEGAANQCVVS